MQTEAGFDALHVALKYLAAACIDEELTEDAETIARFLDLACIAPRTVGLVQVWISSQKGHLRDALRQCEELLAQFPEAEEFVPLAAVLRYACKEPTWRAICTTLSESETASPDSRRLADSLLDGTFGAKPTADPDADSASATAPAIDYAAMGGYMRA